MFSWKSSVQIAKREAGVIGTFCTANFLLFAGLYLPASLSLPVDRGDGKGILFSILLCISHYGTVCVGLSAVLLLFRGIGKRTAAVAAVGVSWLLLLLLLLDTGIFLQWHFHINGPMIALFCSRAGLELLYLPVSLYAAAAAVILAAGGLEYGLWKGCQRFPLPYAALSFLGIYLLCFPCFQVWNAVSFFHSRSQYMLRTDAVPLHFGLTAEDFLLKHGFVPEREKKAFAIDSCGKSRYPAGKLTFRAGKRPNILLIVIDSLRGDFLTPEIMPFLAGHMKNGAVFTDHYSGGNSTRAGMFSLFYGIPGTYWHSFLKSNTPSALMLGAKQCGYNIGIFSSAVLTNPEFDRTIFANLLDLRLCSRGTTPLDRDRNAIEDMFTFLAQHKKTHSDDPFFIMLMTDAIHANQLPNGYPKYFPTDLTSLNYLKLNNSDPTLPGRVLNFYRNLAHSMDDVMAELFSRLSCTGALENTIIVLTSDHGQEANETGTNSWGHNSNYSRYQIHTPMVIWGIPGRTGVFKHRTAHTDVAVTLLKQMGCQSPASDYSVGKDLFDPAPRSVILLSGYTARAILNRDFIFEMQPNGITRSYDLNGKPDQFTPGREVLMEYFEQLRQFMQ